MRKILFISLYLLSFCEALEIGQSGLGVNLSGNNGGLINGKIWKSDMLQGKLSVLFYVDPDSKASNEDFAKKLKKENFDRDKIQSIAIINLGGTWIPNFLIEQRIKSRQEEFPHTTYVFDTTQYLVKKWGFKDDSTDVFIFDKRGSLIFRHFGKLNTKEIKKVLKLLKNKL